MLILWSTSLQLAHVFGKLEENFVLLVLKPMKMLITYNFQFEENMFVCPLETCASPFHSVFLQMFWKIW